MGGGVGQKMTFSFQRQTCWKQKFVNQIIFINKFQSHMEHFY